MQDDILSDIFYKAFEKVIKINLKEGTFEEIENNKQHLVEYSGIDQWFIKFANDSTLCPYDKKRFLSFANIENFKTILADENTTDAGIVYQRKIDGVYHWVMMRIFKINNEEILLTVKDVNQCWLSIEEQQNRGAFRTKEILIKDLQHIADRKTHLGAVIFEYLPKDAGEMADVFTFYFDVNQLYQYDSTHIILLLEEIQHDTFRSKLSQIYNNLQAYNVEIGSNWQKEVGNYVDYMSTLSYNLQINKPRNKAE